MGDSTDRYAVKELLGEELLDKEIFTSYKTKLMAVLDNMDELGILKLKPK